MNQLDYARIVASRRQAEDTSGLHFSVWVGESDEDSRAHASRLHAALPDPERSVYVLCNVRLRTLEVVTGSAARRTLTDEECVLATTSMKALAAEGNVSDALVSGLEHLGTYAVD
jgi:hypothetical protein